MPGRNLVFRLVPSLPVVNSRHGHKSSHFNVCWRLDMAYLASRDKGIDAARGLALVGMLIVHLQTDVFEVSTIKVDSPIWTFVFSIFSNRARPLFILLAGFAAATIIRSRAQHFMFRRSTYVTTIGVALALIGWTDLILVFYGVLFLLAPALSRLNSRMLAFSFGITFCIATYSAIYDIQLLAVISEFLTFFILGMWISLQNRKTVRNIGFLLFTFFIPFALRVGVGTDFSEEWWPDALNWWEVILFEASTIGILFLTIEFCRWLTSRGSLQTLVAIGTMPLTAYIAHVQFLICLGLLLPLSPISVFVSALIFLIVLSFVAQMLFRIKRRGPFEALLRRITTIRV